MTTLEHRHHGELARARGALASVAENAYLRLFATLVVLAAGAAVLAIMIGFMFDIVVPLIFGDELRALAALLPH
ncbi:hypothetical protein [Leifsonia sp. TF02-11]|jgi:hypothetical protein|uniref:hypothetical protein n=1 Tax=Leifsonia sp. TF02-11 TaxID=2815212 RepID=UPI001AA13D1B|nr:hypothetical protein [Leifsonia sp. TF02-11]MBN9632226.1 hypothetical protein [Actinomycetota bacterium]MBO1737726.1 hypothetical protein [Leifsonia sp. TF02-11]